VSCFPLTEVDHHCASGDLCGYGSVPILHLSGQHPFKTIPVSQMEWRSIIGGRSHELNADDIVRYRF